MFISSSFPYKLQVETIKYIASSKIIAFIISISDEKEVLKNLSCLMTPLKMCLVGAGLPGIWGITKRWLRWFLSFICYKHTNTLHPPSTQKISPLSYTLEEKIKLNDFNSMCWIFALQSETEHQLYTIWEVESFKLHLKMVLYIIILYCTLQSKNTLTILTHALYLGTERRTGNNTLLCTTSSTL